MRIRKRENEFPKLFQFLLVVLFLPQATLGTVQVHDTLFTFYQILAYFLL